MLETQLQLPDEKPSLNCHLAVHAPGLGRTAHSYFLLSVAQHNNTAETNGDLKINKINVAGKSETAQCCKRESR